MMRFGKLKVKQKIAVSTAVVIIFFSLVSWLSIQFVVLPSLTDEITNRGEIIANGIALRA